MPQDDKISVTILGSGTCVPSLKRSSCSVLMEIGHSKLLFDCGPGTMRRLLETGTSIFDISYIFFSHTHPDHTSELAPFLFSSKYPNENRKLPLTIVASKDFSKFHDGLKAVYGRWIEPAPGILHIPGLDSDRNDSLKFDDFSVESSPVEHIKGSIAFKVTRSARTSVVYSGDTDFSEDLIALAKGADLLICESALPDAMKVPGHLTPSLAGEIATRAGVHKLVLTHFYPECDKADIEKECRKTYSGPLILAEDLMRVNVQG